MRWPCFPTFTGTKKFLHGIFEDVDGDPSAKRTGFFIFIALIVICVIGAVFFGKTVPDKIWDGLVDLVKWIGTAVLGERIPTMIDAFRGNNRGPEPEKK